VLDTTMTPLNARNGTTAFGSKLHRIFLCCRHTDIKLKHDFQSNFELPSQLSVRLAKEIFIRVMFAYEKCVPPLDEARESRGMRVSDGS